MVVNNIIIKCLLMFIYCIYTAIITINVNERIEAWKRKSVINIIIYALFFALPFLLLRPFKFFYVPFIISIITDLNKVMDLHDFFKTYTDIGRGWYAIMIAFLAIVFY